MMRTAMISLADSLPSILSALHASSSANDIDCISSGSIAAIGHVPIAQATFDAVVAEWPHEHFTLRHGIRLIREHPRG
jgi:hypothetical protein